MKIGIDCRDILHAEKGRTGGIGRYVHELVRALVDLRSGDEFVLFFDDHDAATAKRELSRGRRDVTARVLPFHVFRRIPLLRSHGIVSALFLREKLDLLHGPANAVPLFYRRPSVVTVHDLAVYDHPEWFPARLPGGRSFSERVIVPGSIERAKRVIAVSECTKRDISRLFGTDPARIDVVHEGVTPSALSFDLRTVLARYDLHEKRYVLSLSVLEPRKNVAGLVDAFMRAAERHDLPSDAVLVIAGDDGWKTEATYAAISRARTALGDRRIRRLGRVNEADRAALMAGAAVFAYPSYYEGFGLPPLEAMSVGTNVIASDAASLPEVCGDAAILVDPADTEGLAAAIAQVFADPVMAARLAEQGRKRSAGFTWKRAAQETLETYRKAFGT